MKAYIFLIKYKINNKMIGYIHLKALIRHVEYQTMRKYSPGLNIIGKKTLND